MIRNGKGGGNLFAGAQYRHGQLHAEAERLEWRPNDLINEAYGLTSDEVRLMWATAPPRMPLTPKDDAPEQAESDAAA